MKIAVMSDSHDHIHHLRKAIPIIREKGGEAIIHCGDFVAPFMLLELEQAGIPVHGVFGNNDGDQYLLTKISCTELKHITLHGIAGETEWNGWRVGFAHERVKADGLLMTGRYDLVCFGHTHVHVNEKTPNGMLLNPGDLMGKEKAPGFCMVDIPSGACERITLEV